MKKTVTALAIAAVLALTGCSPAAPVTAPASTVPPVASAAAAQTTAAAPVSVPVSGGKPLAYQFVSMGNATVKFVLPADAADKRLAEIEQFRKDTGTAPVSYIIADVDNRDGLEPVNMYKVSAYDAGGKEYEFTAVSDMISEWGPTYTSDLEYVTADGSKLDDAAGDALQRRGADLQNASLGFAEVSQRVTMILASTAVDLPASFVRVGVQPSGMGEQQDAVLMSEAFGD